jgi:hypothetical protein
MTLDESVHGMRRRVIERAQVMGNVSAVCRTARSACAIGVHPRRQRAQPGRPTSLSPEVERLVLGVAISMAT